MAKAYKKLLKKERQCIMTLVTYFFYFKFPTHDDNFKLYLKDKSIIK